MSNLEVTPLRVETGAPVTVSADVANTGETAGIYSVVLKVDGIAEASLEVSLGAGSSQHMSFDVIRYAAGTFTLAIDEQAASFEVVRDKPLEEPDAARTSNWWLIVGILAALISAIGLMVYISRRQARPAE